MKYYKRTGNELETIYVNHPKLKKTVFIAGEYDWKTDRESSGHLKLMYNNGDIKNISNVLTSPGYGFPYGVPCSDDGSVYYVPGWQNGIRAYRIYDNILIWKSKVQRSRDILLHKDTILTITSDRRLVKISSKTGEVLAFINTAKGKCHLYDFSRDYCLVTLPKCEWGVINKNTFEVVQTFSASSLINKPIIDIFAERDFLNVLEAKVADDGSGMMYQFYEYPCDLDKKILENVNDIDVMERKNTIYSIYCFNNQ